MAFAVSEEWVAKRIRLNSEVVDDAARLRIKSGEEETVAGWVERLFDDGPYMSASIMGIDYEILREKVEGPQEK